MLKPAVSCNLFFHSAYFFLGGGEDGGRGGWLGCGRVRDGVPGWVGSGGGQSLAGATQDLLRPIKSAPPQAVV